MLLEELGFVEWTCDIDDVQNFWDSFESSLVAVIDKVEPVTEFKNNRVFSKKNPVIKNKINK